MDWAINQADRYNCTSIPSWARMPADNYEDAEREYQLDVTHWQPLPQPPVTNDKQ